MPKSPLWVTSGVTPIRRLEHPGILLLVIVHRNHRRASLPAQWIMARAGEAKLAGFVCGHTISRGVRIGENDTTTHSLGYDLDKRRLFDLTCDR